MLALRWTVACCLVLAFSLTVLPITPWKGAALGALWFGLLLGTAAPLARGWALWLALAVVTLSGFGLDPALWLLSACTWCVALPFAYASAADRRAVLPASTLAVVLPALAIVGLLGAGGPGATALRMELTAGWPTSEESLGALLATFVAGAVSFASVCDGARIPRLAKWLSTMAGAGLVLLLLVRGRWMLSSITWPHELQWSESPLLLNLLKLELGVPVYGPAEDCNSYSYSPLLELLHTALLRPFGLNLSLTANRALLLLWHILATLTLCWALLPYTKSFIRKIHESAAPSWLAAVATSAFALCAWLAVTSSFIAPLLHPDHLMMVAFCLAIALVLGEERLPRWAFRLGLVAVPVLATSAKLTGAGIGLGLVLAFAWPWRPVELGWLALAAVLSLATIPLFDATLGQFSAYAIELQASHPIRWQLWSDSLRSGAGKALLSAAAMVLLVWMAQRLQPSNDGSKRRALKDAGRLALLTLGFSLPSMLAYLKEGGRENSLLPWVISATALGIRFSPLLASRWPLFAPAALGVLLLAAPPERTQSQQERANASARAEKLATLAQHEVQLGRSTLLYGATSLWLSVLPDQLPLDRPQSIYELALAKHPALRTFRKRLSSGYYDSIVLSSHLLEEEQPRRTGFGAIIGQHFRLLSPESEPGPGEVTPLLYRFMPERAHPAGSQTQPAAGSQTKKPADSQSGKRHAR